MKKKNTIQYWTGKLHLWLGLASGLGVFIIAITGCLYAFQAEIQDLAQPYRFSAAQDRTILPPSRMKAVAEDRLPGKHIHAVLYSGPTRSVQVIFFNFEPFYYDIVYLDPYTAEVLQVKNVAADFFYIVLQGHFYLWLPPEIGQPVVASCTLIFIVLLCSGLYLWWPRKKKDRRQKFSIRWKARWRRVNYDLHSILGFYACGLALVFALTGLVWGFQWFAQGIYSASGGTRSLTYSDPLSDTTRQPTGSTPAIDQVYQKMVEDYPEANSIEVHIPHSPAYAIAANANPENGTYWKIDYRYFDQNTLAEIQVDHIYSRFPEARIADKLIRLNYDVHTGAILGLPGKILAFLVSLVCAGLPVTGFYIWWGRKKKYTQSEKLITKTFEKTGGQQAGPGALTRHNPRKIRVP